MPREGLSCGPILVELPSLEELLKVQQDTFTTVVDIRVDSTKISSDTIIYADPLEGNPTRIWMPVGDSCYLDSFFAALDSAGTRHVRVIHYGDSQIEGDRISSSLREYLQDHFGGTGAGMLPFYQSLGRMTVLQSTTHELKYYTSYGPAFMRSKHRRYGPMYQYSQVDDTATTHISPFRSATFPHCGQFVRFTMMAKGCGSITLNTDGKQYDITPDSNGYKSVVLPQKVRTASVIADGQWELYGMLLDDTVGVSLDNVPMRSYDGTAFSSVDMSSIRPFFNDQNIRLIMLQFGTNAVPWLKTKERISEWGNLLGMQIDWIHRVCPKACILLIGPPDMSTKVKGEWQTYPLLPEVVKEMRETAIHHKAAFWSIYDVMGGMNTMPQWVDSRPQLAGEDYVHFTEKGAIYISEFLTQTLQTYYNNYKLKR